ncbi:MAG: hypothetical protein CFE43_19700 [Burkholderiales bacterium PBB3]|nr:MAG: hypothetical protein CFE43_19700 [Burkholderiales bacterium PBB3]
MPSPTPYAARTTFERNCLAELAALLKNTPWRRKQTAVFRKDGEYFFVGRLNVHRNATRTIALFEAKPLVVDELLWDILGMRENSNEPLSFRAWGAFTCTAVPLRESEIEINNSSAETVARMFVSFLDESYEYAKDLLMHRDFLELLVEHPNHSERGSYAITQVATLISKEKYDEACTIATAHDKGNRTSTFQLHSNGASFHHLAVSWLAARLSSTEPT